jgi:hypothetical protein
MDIKEGTKIPSSTGGTITYQFDKKGHCTGLIHTAGTAYSGKIAQAESKKSIKD